MVINWARGRGLFTGEDPIKMAELSLPKTKQSKNHFKSLNYDEMPSLFGEIEASSATNQTKLALQFTILTCCRTTEVLHCTWNEIDLVKAIWVIPAERIRLSESLTLNVEVSIIQASLESVHRHNPKLVGFIPMESIELQQPSSEFGVVSFLSLDSKLRGNPCMAC